MDFLKHCQQKILDQNSLISMLAYWQFKEYSLVFTNGCFDILHRGHIDYLSKARQLGDVLMVGLNTDDSVRRIKGSERPVNDEVARALTLASLACVDAVVYFDEDTPHNLIKRVVPNVLVKGSDYQVHEIVGADLVQKAGGRIETIDFLDGYSTTSIINKLRKENS